MFTVYGLIDPETRELFYVGMTALRPQKRLRDHVATAKFNRPGSGNHQLKNRITELFDKGCQPALLVLERTADKVREQQWINYFQSQGIALLNYQWNRPIKPKKLRRPAKPKPRLLTHGERSAVASKAHAARRARKKSRWESKRILYGTKPRRNM